MIIYSVIISITLIIVYLLNLLRGCTDILYILKWTSIDILVVFIIDAIIAFVIRRLPEKWFVYKYKVFKIFKWERKFYEAIKIKKWKDKIPELGQLTNFKKNKVREPKNSEYLLRYLMECVYGETIHFLSIILGFLILYAKNSILFLLSSVAFISAPITIFPLKIVLFFRNSSLYPLHVL